MNSPPRRKDVLPGFYVGEMSSPSSLKHFNNLKLHGRRYLLRLFHTRPLSQKARLQEPRATPRGLANYINGSRVHRKLVPWRLRGLKGICHPNGKKGGRAGKAVSYKQRMGREQMRTKELS